MTTYQCTECDAIYPTLAKAARCHWGIGGVQEITNQPTDTMTTTLTSAQAAVFHHRLLAWLDKLDAISPEGYTYVLDPPGKRYARVVMRINGASNSVHAFYEPSTGNVFKAAGWKAPAKGVRFNLLDDASFAAMIGAADWSGRYLYIR